jgi:hypothetical protein
MPLKWHWYPKRPNEHVFYEQRLVHTTAQHAGGIAAVNVANCAISQGNMVDLAILQLYGGRKQAR